MSTTPQTNVSLHEMAVRLLEHDDFVLCGHVSPDGDCLGSQLALAAALRACGKRATCVLAGHGDIEAGLYCLPGLSDMVFADEYEGPIGAFVACDVPTVKRTGDASTLHERAPIHFTIDHHAVDTCMADYNYVDPDAAACAMIIWQLVRELGVALTPDIATCCYVALMTDTGRFQFQNADAAAFSAAADMIAAGADPAACATSVYQSRRLASLRLEQITIERMRIGESGMWALSHVNLADFERVGAVRADAEELIDIVRCIDGVRVACMLREQPEGVRGSLRAKGNSIDVVPLARRFGGGGHKAAAGFTYPGSMDEALAELPALLDALVDELQA